MNNNIEQINADVTANVEEVSSELVVSTLEDENDGNFSAGNLSLREAISLANDREGADTITFDASLNGGTIDNSQESELLISDSLSITGLGRDNLTVNGGFVFNIAEPNIDIAIDGLNIVGGTVDNSGNLTFSNSQIRETLNINGSSDYYALISRENVNIINSSIQDNDGGDNVGVVIESGTATIEGSTIANNSGVLGAAGIIINSDATADISNSTIANNSSRSGGGVANAGTVNISNSTIADNQGGRTAGGIINRGNATVTSSIVANNTGNNGTFAVGDVYNITDDAMFASGGNNLIGNGDDASGFVDGVNGDLVGSDGDDPLDRQLDLLIDPQLGELQNNGGLTETYALLENSPAIDAGSNPNNLATDQRGEGFNRTLGDGTDIGAYEVQNDGVVIPTELVVSTLEDENDDDYSDGDLSLREAIALANEQSGEDTITFDASLSGGAIVFDSSLSRNLAIDDSLAINGLGQDNLTLDGGFIFDVAADTDFAIDGLNLTGGKIDSDGDLTFSNSTISQTAEVGSVDNSAIVSRDNATITDSSIKDNRGGGNVGILFESGTGTIEGSAITGNDSTDYAQSGVIVGSDATVDISNSTIANNQARSIGGVSNSGTVNINNTTIANNTGGLLAGGIYNSVGGTVTLTSSLLANNTGSANIGDISGDGEYISGGNNLISNGDDAVGFEDGVNGDLVGSNGDDPLDPQRDLLIDPQLGELQNNGGSTETIALLNGSPAIDAGSNPNNLATDQRGEGFNRTVGNGTDIGAYEVQDNDGGEIPEELVVSTLEDENDDDYSDGDLSLREAIALAENDEKIAFDSNLSGGSIILSQGELLIDKSISINGLGANNLTIDGNNSSRIFLVDDGNDGTQANIFVSGLTLKDGNSLNSSIDYLDGGGFLNRENLTVTDSALIGNRAGNGGAVHNTGNLRLENSLVSQSDGTGPVNNDGGVASIFNSTFANNAVGGVSAIVNNNAGTLDLANSTITDNSGYGAALFNSEDSTATVSSTIVAGNLAELPEEEGKDDILGNYISNGNNIIGNTNGGSGFDNPSDLVGTVDNPLNPRLGELQDNGGLTQTVALLEDSPAIDAGSNPNNLAFDQRGEGFDRTVGNGTDVGAFEVQTIPSDNEIIGTDNSDFLRGTNDGDRIFGLDGDDLIKGLNGNDFLSGDGGNDYLQGDNGSDTIEGNAGNDFIDGNNGNDVLFGSEGHDRIVGGNGVDTIDDGAGNDVLLGGNGGDRFLASNPGYDNFTGGRGNDIYVYNLNSDAGFFDRDRILDFDRHEDKVAFRPYDNDPGLFDDFSDLDTNASGVLDAHDNRVNILYGSTVIDFSDLYGRSHNSDTLTFVGVSDLDSDNFLFNETV